jgi:hypothetical protein
LTEQARRSKLKVMNAVEFITELSERPQVSIPSAVAAQLPKSGQARIIILTGEDPDDTEWRNASYEQFMRDDANEDSIYDNYR